MFFGLVYFDRNIRAVSSADKIKKMHGNGHG